MLKYVFSLTALMVSVAGVGISVAREEIRCYLGLSSEACDSSDIKSSSPTKPVFNRETIAPSPTKTEQVTPQVSEQPTSPTSPTVETIKPELDTPKTADVWVKKRPQDDDKFISVEELSRMPKRELKVNSNPDLPSGEEGYVGIPIEVEPYQEP